MYQPTTFFPGFMGKSVSPRKRPERRLKGGLPAPQPSPPWHCSPLPMTLGSSGTPSEMQLPGVERLELIGGAIPERSCWDREGLDSLEPVCLRCQGTRGQHWYPPGALLLPDLPLSLGGCSTPTPQQSPAASLNFLRESPGTYLLSHKPALWVGISAGGDPAQIEAVRVASFGPGGGWAAVAVTPSSRSVRSGGLLKSTCALGSGSVRPHLQV